MTHITVINMFSIYLTTSLGLLRWRQGKFKFDKFYIQVHNEFQLLRKVYIQHMGVYWYVLSTIHAGCYWHFHGIKLSNFLLMRLCCDVAIARLMVLLTPIKSSRHSWRGKIKAISKRVSGTPTKPTHTIVTGYINRFKLSVPRGGGHSPEKAIQIMSGDQDPSSHAPLVVHQTLVTLCSSFEYSSFTSI